MKNDLLENLTETFLLPSCESILVSLSSPKLIDTDTVDKVLCKRLDGSGPSNLSSLLKEFNIYDRTEILSRIRKEIDNDDQIKDCLSKASFSFSSATLSWFEKMFLDQFTGYIVVQNDYHNFEILPEACPKVILPISCITV
ncbi:hypothetical protein Ciccas_003403 [Cichlidogyrus casuarinus]|uniref:Uncharacterized protein n=1 Tax=Cichlidogyrus casuarinus TaxID=1844966 RepID=A0ABD2QEH3_9PLAT